MATIKHRRAMAAAVLAILMGGAACCALRGDDLAPTVATTRAQTSALISERLHGAPFGDRQRRDELAAIHGAVRRGASGNAPAPEPFAMAGDQQPRQRMVWERQHSRQWIERSDQERRERNKPVVEAERDRINADYFNEIFNIQLRLDNAKMMRLKEPELEELKARQWLLKFARGKRQIALWHATEDRYAAGRAADEQSEAARLSAEQARVSGEIHAALARQRADVNVRNGALAHDQPTTQGD